MGHTAVTQTPSHNGNDGQEAVRSGGAGHNVIGFGHIQITGQCLGIGDDGIPAAGYFHTEQQDDDDSDSHKNTLHQVGGTGCQEAAGYGIAHDDNGADDHCQNIVHAEDAAEQFAAGSEAGCCVGNEEHDDNNGRDTHEDIFVITVSAGEKVRHGDGVICHVGVDTDSLGNDEPVEIRTDGKTNGCPCSVRNTGEVSDAGQTHEEPAAHVRGFGTHSRYKGTKLSAAQVKVIYILIFL